MLTLAITGHRPDKLNREYDLLGPLTSNIRDKIRYVFDELKPSHFITGMALGVDWIGAQVAIEKSVPFTAAIPCHGQESKWPNQSQQLYHELLRRAYRVHYVTKGPYNHACMQMRNMWMVDNCTKLLAVWDGSEGGTANCIKYATKIRREIIMLKLNEVTSPTTELAE